MAKTCTSCRNSLSLNQFSKTQLRKYKKQARCKSCVSSSGNTSLLRRKQGNLRPVRDTTDARLLAGYSSESSAESTELPRCTKRKRSDSLGSSIKQRKLEHLVYPSSRVRRVHQLGDGNCLYRSLVHGLPEVSLTHQKLRQLLASWVLKNKSKSVNGAEISKWIRWEKDCNVFQYCRTQRNSSYAWGGQIELCAFSHLFDAEIDVFEFESNKREYKRVTNFPSASKNTTRRVNLLYVNKNHYDALVIK